MLIDIDDTTLYSLKYANERNLYTVNCPMCNQRDQEARLGLYRADEIA
jgi:hypothetical protein